MLRRPGIRHQRAPAVVGSYSPVWPPTSLPGCVAWYDMQETFAEAAGTISSIRNMVTGSDDMAEATNQPTYNPTGINGLPAAVGNGSNKKLVSTEASVASAVSGTDKTWTAFVVTDQGTAASACLFGFGNSGNATPRGQFVSTTNAVGKFRYTTAKVADAGAVITITREQTSIVQPVVIAVVCEGSNVSIISNLERPETYREAYAVGPMTINQVGLLCRPRQTPDLFSAGRLGCALLYSRTLSITETWSISAALMGRWRIPA